MPVAQNNKVLFIHIPKNAGKSIEVALGITTSQEAIKYTWRKTLNRIAVFLLRLTKDKKSHDRIWGIIDYTFTAQHLTLQEILNSQLINPYEKDNFITIAVVRNPYDRAVSSYNHFCSQNTEQISFLDFLNTFFVYQKNDRHNVIAHKRTQSEFLRDTYGNIKIKYLLRFENLNEDFKSFADDLNLNQKSLDKIGAKKRNHNNYRKYYCDESKKIIEEYFKDDLENFSYTF
ncbi:sulfotransferase family 2 domain-containing protein [Flammeovirga sp. SJP92]|uniref:sulfotransferase family 2 domain-containing protein n=1 Tax=Flammeovirga sp. SJP92 TaxID=1775430 RepID=UPI00078738D5|nr:sulfotransferase family 2 domain-containing protein [Flammeovirga sp. SJP92]KXX72544.1 hypothetical protein AVL50_00295 [Flammeovirga sp. SJP92]